VHGDASLREQAFLSSIELDDWAAFLDRVRFYVD
jgi:hypothetical protein